MLISALCMLPVLYAPFSTNLWLVVALISLATAAHQGWSANLFTLASDMFPRRAVGSVVGIGATGGALGRRAHSNHDRLCGAADSFVSAAIYFCGNRIRGRARHHSLAIAKTGTCGAKLTMDRTIEGGRCATYAAMIGQKPTMDRTKADVIRFSRAVLVEIWVHVKLRFEGL